MPSDRLKLAEEIISEWDWGTECFCEGAKPLYQCHRCFAVVIRAVQYGAIEKAAEACLRFGDQPEEDDGEARKYAGIIRAMHEEDSDA